LLSNVIHLPTSFDEQHFFIVVFFCLLCELEIKGLNFLIVILHFLNFDHERLDFFKVFLNSIKALR